MCDGITQIGAVRADLHQLIGAIRDQDEGQRQQERERQREKHDITDRILAAERDINEHKQREERTYRNLNLWVQSALAASTALAFIAAAIYASFAYGQWQTMSKTYDEIKAQTTSVQEAARAAASNANTSSQALKAGIDNFQAQQRAMVAVNIVFFPAELHKVMRLSTVLINSGKTFAVNVRMCAINDKTMDSKRLAQLGEAPEPPKFKKCGAKDWSPPAVIPPDSRGEHLVTLSGEPWENGVGDDLLKALNSGQMVLWQYGEVTYDDVFEQHHWSKFCFYRAVRDGLVAPLTCQTGNDVDRPPKQK